MNRPPPCIWLAACIGFLVPGLAAPGPGAEPLQPAGAPADLTWGERHPPPGLIAAFLRHPTCRDLLIEIDYQQDTRPRPETIAALERFLRQYVKLPGGLRIELDQELTPEQVGPPEEIGVSAGRWISRAPRQSEAAATTAFVYVLCYAGAEDVPSLTRAFYPMVLINAGYNRSILEGRGEAARQAEIMTFLHEFGHVLGACHGSDHGAPDLHHCARPECLMSAATRIPNRRELRRGASMVRPPCPDCHQELLQLDHPAAQLRADYDRIYFDGLAMCRATPAFTARLYPDRQIISPAANRAPEEVLAAVLGDPWSILRWYAVDILASEQVRIDPAARRRLARQLLEDPDPTVREHAAAHSSAAARN